MSNLPTNLTSHDLANALSIYLGLAWPERNEGIEIPRGDTLEQMLKHFRDESTCSDKARWSLRLGNAKYPHMKVVVEKALHCERLFLSVDTHDSCNAPQCATDTHLWEKLQIDNARLSRRIEAAWRVAGLPTRESMKDFVATSADPLDEGAPRVLVVDDEEDAARLYAMQIASQGFQVDVAFGGPEALEKMRDNPPDIVLLDYMMPELSGRELALEMRSDIRLSAIPIIIATYAQTKNIDFNVADTVLKKPFSTKEVCSTIASLLVVRT